MESVSCAAWRELNEERKAERSAVVADINVVNGSEYQINAGKPRIPNSHPKSPETSDAG
jgi:hypothetical protein